ncbi:N-acetyl sugar amidotransferase [Alphaproteobacteria bacterium]|nr:N-acetyl sugar amidotransferase [Alphaproteobacteria bacterium]
MSDYQICTNCIMDTTDEEIVFNKHGVCNHCIEFENTTKKNWLPNSEGSKLIKKKIEQIKKEGFGKEYDCIIGLSGGVDSSYLALKVKDWGLKPLVVHVDAGWNSELAVHNIECLVNYCGFDLYTHVVDWEEMKSLQIAYLKAGVANQDVPQDHIFFATLYHFAIKHKIRFVLSGGNIATESIFPSSWHADAMDSINLRAIYSTFSKNRLKNYRTIGFVQYYFWYPVIKKLEVIRPLNFLPYVKEQALNELIERVGYKPYPRKHGESLFTKIFQNYYLPKKFGYDKRRPHLSSLIVSGQISRDEAIIKIKEPLYDENELEIDLDFLCKKLEINRISFDELINGEVRHYSAFNNWDARYRLAKKLKNVITKILRKEIKISY